jgi:hypothetical protein
VLRLASPSPDWYGPTTAPTEPLANFADMSVLESLPDETRSGEHPILAIASVPLSGGALGVTLTDPTLWLYGRMMSAPEVSLILGDEGANELIRVGSVTVQEIP